MPVLCTYFTIGAGFPLLRGGSTQILRNVDHGFRIPANVSFQIRASLVRRSIGTIRASYKEHESEWSRSACHPATRLRQGFLSEADHNLRPILAGAMAILSVQVQLDSSLGRKDALLQ